MTVNGIAAAVANRSFVVAHVPLSPGDNILTAVAVDTAGNTGTAAIRVRLAPPPTARLAVISGDGQQATIGGPLPQPLIVALLDASGAPIAGKTVLFRVRGGSGTVDGGSRGFTMVTDSSGQARAHFTLGKRSGAGSQIVEASSIGAANPATFTASALPGAAAFLVVDSGDQQVGIAGQELPRPLVAVVTDSGFNRLRRPANGQRNVNEPSRREAYALQKGATMTRLLIVIGLLSCLLCAQGTANVRDASDAPRIELSLLTLDEEASVAVTSNEMITLKQPEHGVLIATKMDCVAGRPDPCRPGWPIAALTTIEGLRRFVERLQPGTSLEWSASCIGPHPREHPLSEANSIEEIQKFAAQRHVKFIFHRAG